MTSMAESLKLIDLHEPKARLAGLKGANHNIFEDNNWVFENQHGRAIRIDFNDLMEIHKKYPNWSLSKQVDWILITKVMWLSLATKTTPDCYPYRLSGIKLLWAAMGHHNLTELTRDNIVAVLNFLLLHGWRQGTVSKNLNIKSFVNFTYTTRIYDWKLAFADLGLGLIAPGLTESFVKRQLKEIIPSLSDNDLTYRDWAQGGSLNLLTLDHGRYYIEHCLDFFETNYPIAMALSSTYETAPTLAASLGLEQRNFNHALSLTLQGNSVKSLKSHIPGSSITTLSNIHTHVIEHFNASYRKAHFESLLLKEETLEEFVTACGLNASPENIDRMRIILWDYLRRKDKLVTTRLLSECHTEVPWAVFKKKFSELKKYCDLEPLPVLSADYYKSKGLVRSSNKDSTYPRQLIDHVAKAGLTNVVALTGWRKSEFGFPISSIKRTINKDKLDQYAFPWRYQVDWYVYKTGGNVRQLREITFSILLITERLQQLVSAADDQPCLYFFSQRRNNNPAHSGEIVVTALRSLWTHFVWHYSGFKQLDDWAAWQALDNVKKAGTALTYAEQKDLKRLLEQRTAGEWENFTIDKNLREAWRRAREELPRLELFLTSTTKKDKKDWLARYRARTLRADWSALLDAHLPDNVKDWLHSLSEDEAKDSSVSATITNTLVENTLYPSPHAFRHMWAEAVYRRFDGDAGWMIRSQFKHISRLMWLAYIRDKDNRIGNEKAKSQVISSLVHNYVKHQGEGYAGQLDTWLRRLLKRTAVLSPEEQEKLANHLATVEIENIKSNPWGYCMLKRRTRSRAKCADKGEPMRHNASPDLCLGCIHNLMQTENVEWALFHVASHVEALKNPVVPAIFKESSYNLVKNVTRHVRTLNSQHEALSELQEALDEYRALRAD